jgi:hypothetical protein
MWLAHKGVSGHPQTSQKAASVLHLLLTILTVISALRFCHAWKSDALKAVLNKHDELVQRPLSNLMGSKYIERVAGRYSATNVDTSAIFDMLSAQQVFRRGVQGDSGLNLKGSAYDCQPTYTVEKRVTSWFQTTTIQMGICFTLCMDYPTCTTTVPLVLQQPLPEKAGSQKPELGMLLRCGLKAMDKENGDKVVEVMGRNSKGEPAQVSG